MYDSQNVCVYIEVSGQKYKVAKEGRNWRGGGFENVVSFGAVPFSDVAFSTDDTGERAGYDSRKGALGDKDQCRGMVVDHSQHRGGI